MLAYVRKHGSIGIFYWVQFPGVLTKDEWFEEYGDTWELHHFEKTIFTPNEPSTPSG